MSDTKTPVQTEKELAAAKATADKAEKAAADKAAKEAQASEAPADQFAELKALVESQGAVIASLQESLTAKKEVKKKKLEIPKKAVKVGKKSYQFAVPHFYHDGKYYEAADAAVDNDLLNAIVSIPGQGILKEQF